MYAQITHWYYYIVPSEVMVIWEYLFIGVLFSAIGAVAPGMINLAVAERSIHKGYSSGLMVALGASAVEFLYTFLSIYFIDQLTENKVVGKFITWMAAVIFLLLGLYYILRKVEPIKPVISKSSSTDLFLGVGVAAMNMLIIPTWLFIGIWMRGQGYDFEHMGHIFAVSLGSALGAGFVFVGYVKLGRYVVSKMEKVTAYTNKFVGTVFLILSVVQCLRAMYS